jgi:hypothetical protein
MKIIKNGTQPFIKDELKEFAKVISTCLDKEKTQELETVLKSI